MKAKMAVFVYGTLKEGGIRHSECMSGYDTILPAKMAGNLHNYDKKGSPFPICHIPKASIMANHSKNLIADVKIASNLLDQYFGSTIDKHTGWGEFQGEMCIYEDTPMNLCERIEMLDQIEGFDPKTGESYLGYYRKLALAQSMVSDLILPCFVYTSLEIPEGELLVDGVWPKKEKVGRSYNRM